MTRAAQRLLLDRARLARMVAGIGKPALTRADLVELVGALLPVDAPGDPRALIEQIADTVGVRVSATREAHHRKGHEVFTVDAVIAEEQRIFDLVDAADARARLDVRAADLDALTADQARAIATIAASPYLVPPLQAPAGAGKTHSLQALRAAVHRANKGVLVLAPLREKFDHIMREQAGERLCFEKLFSPAQFRGPTLQTFELNRFSVSASCLVARCGCIREHSLWRR